MPERNPFADHPAVESTPVDGSPNDATITTSGNPFASPSAVGTVPPPTSRYKVDARQLALFDPHRTRLGVLLVHCGILAAIITVILFVIASVPLAVLGLRVDNSKFLQLVFNWIATIMMTASYLATVTGPWFSLRIKKESGKKLQIIASEVLLQLATVFFCASAVGYFVGVPNAFITEWSGALFAAGFLAYWLGVLAYVEFLTGVCRCFTNRGLLGTCRGLKSVLWVLVAVPIIALATVIASFQYSYGDLSVALDICVPFAAFATSIMSIFTIVVYASLLRKIGNALGLHAAASNPVDTSL